MQHRDYKTSAEAADLIRAPLAKLYEIQEVPESKAFTPERQPVAVGREYRPQHILPLMMVSDLHRWGVPVPHAVRVVCHIADRCDLYAEIDNVVISFHEIGASFVVGSGRTSIPDLPLEGDCVGHVRFRIVFEMAAYRVAVREAFAPGGELATA